MKRALCIHLTGDLTVIATSLCLLAFAPRAYANPAGEEKLAPPRLAALEPGLTSASISSAPAKGDSALWLGAREG
ncbi:MAG: hypothetical protein NTW03_06985 [Verrucomicrobia bacterium]|nr:hypothetical protein [Verrucomicrobiota bacterium]